MSDQNNPKTYYAVRGVLTQQQLDRLPPQVYAELQVFDPATSTWSEYGIETADGCTAKNPPFEEIADVARVESEGEPEGVKDQQERD